MLVCFSVLCTVCESNTRGFQKVCSLIQLTTEYEHNILSLFNIVLFDRNALGPAILQSPYPIIEEFLILVLQPTIRGADNIVVSKFSSFRDFFSFGNKLKSVGAKSGKYDGWRSSLKLAFRWQSVLAMTYEQVMKQYSSSQLSSSLLFQCCSTFSNQISIVCSCNSSPMFQILVYSNKS